MENTIYHSKLVTCFLYYRFLEVQEEATVFLIENEPLFPKYIWYIKDLELNGFKTLYVTDLAET